MYAQTRTTIDVLFITMTGYSICVHKIYLKYLCKKYLTNCNFVLIILKLLTINKKAMQYTYLKKPYARVNYNTHYHPHEIMCSTKGISNKRSYE
jgi:hypothetical protein